MYLEGPPRLELYNAPTLVIVRPLNHFLFEKQINPPSGDRFWKPLLYFAFFTSLKTMLACREIKPESSFITQNFLKNNLLIAKMLLDTLVVLFRRIERKEGSRN